MLLLVIFAFVAGAGTAVSPCVLPVLPAFLSASATGGRRRPLGIALGLVITFTVTTVALASVVKGVGLSNGATRTIAIVFLIGFGVALAVPALGDRLEAPLSRLARFGPSSTGSGFLTGLLIGGALGFVYLPCAGPILAAVISVSASQGTSVELVALGLAYGVGSGVVLLALALGGRRLLERLRKSGRGLRVQRVMGAVLLVTGIAMAFSLDTRFQTALANHFPSAIVNPTKAIEESNAAKRQLADLRGRSRFESEQASVGASDSSSRPSVSPEPAAPNLPVLGTAPDFQGTGHWFNTAGGKPLSLAGLRGRVVLIDFWTYTCINCLRTLPFLKTLDRTYRKDGLTIVGVHTPEFGFEHKTSNVADAIRQNGLRYPTVQDNAYATWNAWGNQYWPAEYLIDAKGKVRHTNSGEGGYAETEAAVRELLREAGNTNLPAGANAHGVAVTTQEATPETYIGSARAERFLPSKPRSGTHTYSPLRGALPESHFTLGGSWNIKAQAATAVRNATLSGQLVAKEIYLVMGSAGGKARQVRVSLDGAPLPNSKAGADVHNGVATIRGQRLYRLTSLPMAQSRRLTLSLDPGISAFAFTFG